jgi:hypothetical protein
VIESVAWILLMFLAIALIIAFIKGGTKGVGSWLHAKYVGTAA